MNHSLLSADRNTHVKIVSVALLAGMLVVGVAIKARVTPASQTRSETAAVVLKAGKAVFYTRSETPAIN